MPLYQSRPLILDRDQPIKIPQAQSTANSAASSADVSAIQVDLDAAELDISTNTTNVTAAKSVTDQLSALADYADDSAASAGGIAVGEFYRTGSTIKQRVV